MITWKKGSLRGGAQEIEEVKGAIGVLLDAGNIGEEGAMDELVNYVESQFRRAPIKTLDDVGLSYIKLGQAATTLSGGEAQRVKLAKELSKRSTGKTVYILDEPTTGLHFADVQKLLEVLHMLVDKGNTVIVIEHNLDVIKNSDWIIDLGPEGGENGGTIIGEGTPESICKNKFSLTGKHLKEVLNGKN